MGSVSQPQKPAPNVGDAQPGRARTIRENHFVTLGILSIRLRETQGVSLPRIWESNPTPGWTDGTFSQRPEGIYP